jgi:hypothetical protein
LAKIVESFGEVTVLCINFQKISVVSVRCGDI